MEEYVIYTGADLRNRPNIKIGKGVVIQRDVWIDARGKVIIGEGSNIGRRCVLGSGKLVEIGKKVLLGPGTYINDMDHAYQDITRPIMDQGITNPRPIKIGDGSWTGINSVVRASMGKNCVLGANSVLTHDLPDYCMAAGQPAIIRKQYDPKTKKWKSLNWINRIGLLRKVKKLFHQLLH